MFILFVVSCAFAQNVVFDECKVTKDYGFQQYTFSVYGDVYVETDPKEPVDLEVKVIMNDLLNVGFMLLPTSLKIVANGVL